jgi:glycine/D-amino acid oxidase-like deaminating enzyme
MERDADRRPGRRAFLAGAAGAAIGAAAIAGRRPVRADSESFLPIPTLEGSRVIRRTAGLRPYRDGGIRIETETIGTKKVVHDYGHGGAGVTLSWGSAALVADLVAAAAPAGSHRVPVAVLGCGAVGLAAARVLLERGHPVRILARDFPPRTTSNLSGAMWLPVSVDPGPDRARFRKLAADSWTAFAALSLEADSGVVRRTLYETEGVPAAEADLPKEMLATKRDVPRLPFPGSARGGRSWETFLIEPPVYLPALMRDVLRSGAVFAQKTIDDPSDLAALEETVVVNCLGLGAGEVFRDPAVVPVRGQLVALFPEPLPYLLTHRGGYCFPRGDAVILGGTFERGVADETPDPAACARILESHRRFFAL